MSRLSASSETTPLLRGPSQPPDDVFVALSKDPKQFGYASSEEEAKELIKRIQGTLLAMNVGHPMWQGVIDKVAEGQYGHPMHFLFELLQNADDVNYGTKHPQVNIRRIKGYLLFETNEIGFSDANVISICSVTLSTKKCTDSSNEYIGEKGIGFKSVFMIAKRVWVQSRHYSFRFDGYGEGARIFPHWDRFPRDAQITVTEGSTAILMELKDGKPETEMDNLLEKLDPTLLLFLRQIKDVTIEFSQPKGLLGTVTWSDRQIKLRADKIPTRPRVLYPAQVHKNETTHSYLAYRHHISSVPKNENRYRRTSAEIILLLPDNISPGQPLPTQKVFAYLPIKDYGLRFAIQSDFLLIANREGVPSNDWNKALLDNVSAALLGAINRLNRDNSHLRYKWPLLLPVEKLLDEVLQYNPDDTITIVAQNNVLEDVNGKLWRPRELTFIPGRFRDGRGVPLLPPHISTRRILSEKYPKEAQGHLERLGIHELSDEGFLHDFKNFISKSRLEFQGKSPDWHSRVSTILLDMLGKFRSEIECLDLIPLADNNRWVSSESGLAYFPGSDLDGLKFPASIKDMGEIHPDVEKNPKQRELIQELGVPVANRKMFCDAILKWHEDTVYGFIFLPVPDLVQHLVVLYRAQWPPYGVSIPDLWCATSSGRPRRTSDIYMPANSDQPFSASFMAAKCNVALRFLHPEYLKAFGDIHGGLYWLEKTLGVSKTVRIAKMVPPEGYEPHGDLEELISKGPVEVLLMLKHHWKIYSRWFGVSALLFTETTHPSAEKMRHRIARMKVPCCHGTNRMQLKDTVLPRENLHELFDLSSFESCNRPERSCYSCSWITSLIEKRRHSLQESDGFLTPNSLLSIDNPNDRGWDFLKIFGVVVTLDYRPFKARLEKMMHDENTRHIDASRVYKQLQQYQRTLDDSALRFMKDNPTIYVPAQSGTSKGTWHKPDSCVWDGPKCLEHVPRLRKFYKDHWLLFQIVLGLPNADLHTLMTEVNALDERANEMRIRALIKSISDEILKGVSDEVSLELQSLRMFPVTVAGGDTGPIEGAVKLLSREEAESWFIPDDPYLRKAFEGKLNLSVIEHGFFFNNPALYHVLKLKELLLKIRDIKKSIQTVGKRLHTEYTDSLREKGPYIRDLAPSAARSSVGKMLQQVQVFQVDHLRATWIWERGDRQVRSREEEVQVAASTDENGQLFIFIVDAKDMLKSLRAPQELKDELARIFDISSGIENDFLNVILRETDKRFYDGIREEYYRRKGERPSTAQEEQLADINDEPDNAGSVQLGENDPTSSPKQSGALAQKASSDYGTVKEREPSASTYQTSSHIPPTETHASVSDIRTKLPTDETQEPSKKIPSMTTLAPPPMDVEEDERPRQVDNPTHCDPDQTPNQAIPMIETASSKAIGAVQKTEAGSQAPSDPTSSPSAQEKSTNLERKPQQNTEPSSEQNSESSPSNASAQQSGSRTERSTTPNGEANRAPTFDSAVLTASHLSSTIQENPDRKPGMAKPALEEHISPRTEIPPVESLPTRSSGQSLLHRDPSPRPPDTSTVVPRGDRTLDSLPRARKPSSHPTSDFVNMRSGTMMFASRPRTLFIGEDTQDTQFFGELHVFRVLENILGKSFRPNEHWTSPLRTYHGKEPFKGTSQDATFTIADADGKLSDSLIVATEAERALFMEPLTFHLQVCATKGEADAGFLLPKAQYKKAMEASTCHGKPVAEIYILARVSRALEDARIAFYTDPWKLHRAGLIELETEGYYRGSIKAAAPAMYPDGWLSAGSTSEASAIYRDFKIGQGQIRLIKLELNSDDMPLKGKLVRVNVNSEDDFWAISYVWHTGIAAGTSPTFETDRGRINITDSLAACLKCLRRKGVTARIWADAVCINQSDDMEKAMQVRRMGSIYKKAKRVVVWTGVEHKGKDDGVIDALLRLQRPAAVPYQDLVTKVGMFLTRPWFGRTWTIQELVFGSDVSVMCGDSEIGWDAFLEGVKRCDEFSRDHPHVKDRLAPTLTGPVLALSHARQRIQAKPMRLFKFLELREMFFYCKSRYMRDQLFAFLNMTHDTSEERTSFYPNYSSSDDTILARYAQGFVVADQVLDLLYRAGFDKSTYAFSWVPDLANERKKEYYPPTISTWDALGPNGQRQFKAGKNAASEAHVVNQKCLSIRGYIFDFIDSCKSLKVSPETNPETQLAFVSVLDGFRRYLSHLSSYPTLQVPVKKTWKDELLLKTLIGNAAGPQKMHVPFFFKSQEEDDEKKDKESWPDGFENEVLAVQPDQDANDYLSKDPTSATLIRKYWETVNAFLGRIPKAAACITRDSYVGLVPGDARLGDVLFIAHGADVPFVLRKVSETDDTAEAPKYTLIGECYLHDLMFDERCYKLGEKKSRGGQNIILV